MVLQFYINFTWLERDLTWQHRDYPMNLHISNNLLVTSLELQFLCQHEKTWSIPINQNG